MKCLILMPLAEQRGGAEQLLLDLLTTATDLAEWEVGFLQKEGSMIMHIQQLGIPTWSLAAGRLRDLSHYVKTIKSICRHLRASNPHCVLSWMGKTHLYGGPAAFLAKTPAVWHQHGIPQNHPIDRLATLLPSKGIIVVSRSAAAAQARLWPKRSIRLVHPGSRLERFNPCQLPSPQEVRCSLELPPTGPLIGMVGRLQRWKGMHTLIQAMPLILQEFPEAHCVIVGGEHNLEPDYPSYLRQLIEALNLQQQVILAGFQKNVEQWMQACDIVVHASDNEPFGLVIIEAMALGKPVVAASEGGPRDIITEGVDGLLAPYNQPQALAQAIMRYLRNPDFAQKVGKAAQKRALEFSTRRYGERLVEAIRELLSS